MSFCKLLTYLLYINIANLVWLENFWNASFCNVSLCIIYTTNFCIVYNFYIKQIDIESIRLGWIFFIKISRCTIMFTKLVKENLLTLVQPPLLYIWITYWFNVFQLLNRTIHVIDEVIFQNSKFKIFFLCIFNFFFIKIAPYIK